MKISVRFLQDHDAFIEPTSSLSRFSVPLLPGPLEALSLGTTQRFDVLFGVYESDTHAKDRLRLLTGEGGWQDWHGGVQTRADATTVITLLRVAQGDAVAGARR